MCHCIINIPPRHFSLSLGFPCNSSDLAHVNYATDAVTSVHIVEGLINAAQVLSVRNELIDLQLAIHVVLNKAAHLTAALDATESTSLPDTTGDQLES